MGRAAVPAASAHWPMLMLGLVLAVAGYAHAAPSCQPLVGAPSMCKLLMGIADGDLVYVKDGVNVTMLVKQASTLISSYSSPLGNKDCYEVGVRFACASALMRCVVLGGTTAFPTMPCRTLCNGFNRICAGSLALAQTPPVNCSLFQSPENACSNATSANPPAVPGQTNAPTPQCVAWKGTPSVCSPLVPTVAGGGYARVFVPSGASAAYVTAVAAAGINSLSTSPYTSEVCFQAALRYICSASFMTCLTPDEIVALGFPAAYKGLTPAWPYFPDPIFCRAANTACRGVFAVGGLPAFNCTESDPPAMLTSLPGMRLPFRNASLDVNGVPFKFAVPSIIGHPLPRCELWKGQPSVCGLLVRPDKPIFVDEYRMGGNQSYLIGVASHFATALSNRFVPTDCYQAAMKFACLQAFMPCYEPRVAGLPPLLPMMPCMSLCQQANTLCAATLARGGSGPIDCSSVTPLAPGLPCANGNTSVYGTPTRFATHNWVPEDCSPLVLRTDGVVDPVTGPCTTSCFVEIIPPDHYQLGVTMNIIMAALSNFLGWFLAFNYIANPQYRSFPRNMPVWIGLCSGLSGLSQWLPAALGRNYTLCNDPYTPATFGYLPCTLSGSLLIFAGLSIGTWWTCCAVNLYLLIVHDLKKRQFKLVYTVYHVFSWGFPALCTAIALAKKSVVFGAGQIWCFITVNEMAASLSLFYVPFLVFTLIGMAMVGLCVVKIARIQRAASIENAVPQAPGGKRKRRRKHLVPPNTYRMIAFVIAMIFIASFIVGYGIDSVTSTARKRAYFEDYVECMLTTPGPECGGPMHELDYVLWYMNILVCSFQGVVIFLLFGTNPDVYAWGPFVKFAHLESATATSKNGVSQNSGYESTGASESGRGTRALGQSGMRASRGAPRSTEMSEQPLLAAPAEEPFQALPNSVEARSDA